ncbi:hypothetical protein V8C86DRAFT_3026648 [Haematococcus lacustris]
MADLFSAWAKVARRLPASAYAPGRQQQQLEQIIKALRLALVRLDGLPPRPDGRSSSRRAVQLAARLAELSAAGLPLDADAIAAGVLLEAAAEGCVDADCIREQLGPQTSGCAGGEGGEGGGVAGLVHDLLLVHSAPQRVPLYDDTAASAIREWCIASSDIRASAVEVVARWDALQHMARLPLYEQQHLALEALQVYAPLGHALGLGAVSARIEDLCFKVLLPGAYLTTRHWMHSVVDPAESALFAAQQQLLAALELDPVFSSLARGCVVRARTKSLLSLMKKVVRLGQQGRGRRREEVFDLLGMRAIVQPRTDMDPSQAEAAAVQACYVVAEVAGRLWGTHPDRVKDYIAHPKPNGYRSIHLTVDISSVQHSLRSTPTPQPAAAAVEGEGRGGGEGQAGVGEGSTAPSMELQVRTEAMDQRAEAGDAAHTAYKGGLDARQARQLQHWTAQLQRHLASPPSPSPDLTCLDLPRSGSIAGPLAPLRARLDVREELGARAMLHELAGLHKTGLHEACGQAGGRALARARQIHKQKQCRRQLLHASAGCVASQADSCFSGLFEVQEEPSARARLVAQPQFGNESPNYQLSAAAGLEAAAQPSAVALTQPDSTADNGNLQQSPAISGPAAQELYQLLHPLAPTHSHPHSTHQPADPLAASPASNQAPAAELCILHSPAEAKLVEGPGPVISNLRLQHGPVDARKQQPGCFSRTPAAAILFPGTALDGATDTHDAGLITPL